MIAVLVGGVVSQPSTNTLVFNEEYTLLLSNAMDEKPDIAETKYVTIRSTAAFRSKFFTTDTMYVRFSCGITHRVQLVQVISDTDSTVEELLQFDSVISLISSEVWPIELFTTYTSVYFKDNEAAQQARSNAGYGSIISVQTTKKTLQTTTQLTLVETNGCPQKVYNLLYAFFGCIILVYSLLFCACISCIKQRLRNKEQTKMIAEPSSDNIIKDTSSDIIIQDTSNDCIV